MAIGDVATRPFRFAVQTRSWNDRDQTVAAALQAEQLGYEELYSFDHVGAVDPLIPLMVAASATTTLRVGPLVINNELHHPALLARSAATVDRLTGGRLVLGLGTGYALAEHEAIHVPLRPPRQRVDRFAESLDILRDLLDANASNRTGVHHTVALDDLGVRPIQAHIPFLIGGFGRRMIELAAVHADIFQFTGLVDRPDGTMQITGFELAEVARRSEWLAEAAGQRGASIERSALVQFVHVGDDAPSAADIAGRFELDDRIVADSPFLLSGSVEQLVDKLERVRQATGISHYVIREPEQMAPVVSALGGR